MSDSGPIALVKNGETITIDAEKRELTLEVPSAELKKRKKAWNPAKRDAPRYTRGVFAKYAAHVTSASLGAVTDAEHLTKFANSISLRRGISLLIEGMPIRRLFTGSFAFAFLVRARALLQNMARRHIRFLPGVHRLKHQASSATNAVFTEEM